MTKDESEWKFVSRGGNSKHRNPRDGDGRGFGKSPLRQQLETQNTLFQSKFKQDGQQQLGHDTLCSKEIIERAIFECLDSFERQIKSGEGFAFRLYDALIHSTGSTVSVENNNKDVEGNEETDLSLKEIVAYGIGNFAGTTYSAPMLQFAGVLLLRRLATSTKVSEGRKNCEDKLKSEDEKLNNGSFENEQRQVPIYYYEPCILPIEKQLLETSFHVHVLEGNDSGKLTIRSIRQEHRKLTSSPGTIENQHRHTLFYLPHCPMRLYCNVLWAHWENIISQSSPSENVNPAEMLDERSVINDPIIIFGNSFHLYNDRAISQEQRKDPTNGIIPLIQCCQEIPVYISAENSKVDNSLQRLEVAFNDCNVISFSRNGVGYLERPKEYVPSEEMNTDGELI